jgi:hypothetical protein
MQLLLPEPTILPVEMVFSHQQPTGQQHQVVALAVAFQQVLIISI